MERRAGYFMVGLFVLLLGAGLMVFVVWLAKHHSQTSVAVYDIIYPGSVTGLKIGSTVRFSGVTVGEVTGIRLFEEDPSKVRITVEVGRSTPVNSSTRATVALEGITGGRSILLTSDGKDGQPLEPPAPGENPRIPAVTSGLDQLLDEAPAVVEGVQELISRANHLLSDRNRALVTSVLSDAATVTHTLASNNDKIEMLLQDSAETMENIKRATESIARMTGTLADNIESLTNQADATLTSYRGLADDGRKTLEQLRGDIRTLMGTLQTASDAFADAMIELEAIAAENREPIKDFTGTGLYEFTTFLIEARGLVRELSRITTEVERDPARFFFGDTQQGYETQQQR